MATDDVQVSKREKDFEITVGGEHAGLVTLHDRGENRALPHTEIDEAFQGQGLASVLIKAALDQTRAEGLKVLPFCPAVQKYVLKHEEYQDLVPEDRRAEFGL